MSYDNHEKTGDGDLTDMLGELRVLLLGSQLLTGFLIAVPFAPGFRELVGPEKYVFLATFVFALVSLVLLSAPAIQHRLIRPLRNRERFKNMAGRTMVFGAATLAIALVLATQLVLSTVMGSMVGNVSAGVLAVLIVVMWWLLPWVWRRLGRF